MNNTIYIGPRMNDSAVMPNELFTERPDEIISRLKEKNPLIDFLFVTAKEYARASAEVQTEGTTRYKAYMQAKGGNK